MVIHGIFTPLDIGNKRGLWSSGMTRHSHCRDGSSILPRSTMMSNGASCRDAVSITAGSTDEQNFF